MRPLYGEIALVLGDDDALRVYSYVAENAKAVGEYRRRAEQALAPTIEVDDLLAMADVARQALDLLRALRLYELALPRLDDDAHTAAIIANIGLVQREVERFEEALASLQRALAIKERVYGTEHHEVASTLSNLGKVQSDLGRFEEALASLQRALAIKERVHGTEHHEVASTLTNLGKVQSDLGRLSDAESSARRALAIFQTQLPTNHPHTTTARRLLAGLGAARGEVLLNITDDDGPAGTDASGGIPNRPTPPPRHPRNISMTSNTVPRHSAGAGRAGS